jgi:hypothetical protein
VHGYVNPGFDERRERGGERGEEMGNGKWEMETVWSAVLGPTEGFVTLILAGWAERSLASVFDCWLGRLIV